MYVDEKTKRKQKEQMPEKQELKEIMQVKEK